MRWMSPRRHRREGSTSLEHGKEHAVQRSNRAGPAVFRKLLGQYPRSIYARQAKQELGAEDE